MKYYFIIYKSTDGTLNIIDEKSIIYPSEEFITNIGDLIHNLSSFDKGRYDITIKSMNFLHEDKERIEI